MNSSLVAIRLTDLDHPLCLIQCKTFKRTSTPKDLMYIPYPSNELPSYSYAASRPWSSAPRVPCKPSLVGILKSRLKRCKLRDERVSSDESRLRSCTWESIELLLCTMMVVRKKAELPPWLRQRRRVTITSAYVLRLMTDTHALHSNIRTLCVQSKQRKSTS